MLLLQAAKHEYESHQKRMQSIMPTVDSSTPSSFVLAQQQSPTKKSMLTAGEKAQEVMTNIVRLLHVAFVRHREKPQHPASEHGVGAEAD